MDFEANIVRTKLYKTLQHFVITNKFIILCRGKPIHSRQQSRFMDENGVPIPILPYAKSDENETNAWKRG
ncbi:unnamed protein product [Thelazia callipaeda]|uniref:Uncharacterized protein n=1 Tax=Thelazia callipaeda TaxID=103827 RepID=A0A0N5CJD6_THECL|nr:unnamed protein product [Thelazia callipaeda]